MLKRWQYLIRIREKMFYRPNRRKPNINIAISFGGRDRVPRPCHIASSFSQSTSSSEPTTFQPKRNIVRLLFSWGLVCSFVSLVIAPELFGSMAILLGAYTWRLERYDSRNSGLIILILGLVFMFVGILFTSYFRLADLIP